MKHIIFPAIGAALLASMAACGSGDTTGTKEIPYGSTVSLSREQLLDKIKGGWAGQTIGSTYGGPTEFK
ncbi:MAG: hypothetical protein K2O33_06130 [Muribaculaceae bacterium]|nr:hypothetical protein [Muribaculaceae bacterium]